MDSIVKNHKDLVLSSSPEEPSRVHPCILCGKETHGNYRCPDCGHPQPDAQDVVTRP